MTQEGSPSPEDERRRKLKAYCDALVEFDKSAKSIEENKRLIKGIGQILQYPGGPSTLQPTLPSWPAYKQLTDCVTSFRVSKDSLWKAYNQLEDFDKKSVQEPPETIRVVRKEGRRNGSTLLALILSLIAVVCALFQLLNIHLGDLVSSALHFNFRDLAPGEHAVNFFAGLSFGLILLWWADLREPSELERTRARFFYPGRSWGLGNESVTMAVTVIAALIVTFTLTHELFNEQQLLIPW